MKCFVQKSDFRKWDKHSFVCFFPLIFPFPYCPRQHTPVPTWPIYSLNIVCLFAYSSSFRKHSDYGGIMHHWDLIYSYVKNPPLNPKSFAGIRSICRGEREEKIVVIVVVVEMITARQSERHDSTVYYTERHRQRRRRQNGWTSQPRGGRIQDPGSGDVTLVGRWCIFSSIGIWISLTGCPLCLFLISLPPSILFGYNDVLHHFSVSPIWGLGLRWDRHQTLTLWTFRTRKLLIHSSLPGSAPGRTLFLTVWTNGLYLSRIGGHSRELGWKCNSGCQS